MLDKAALISLSKSVSLTSQKSYGTGMISVSHFKNKNYCFNLTETEFSVHVNNIAVKRNVLTAPQCLHLVYLYKPFYIKLTKYFNCWVHTHTQ